MKNTNASMKPFIVKSRYRVGAEKKKEVLIKGMPEEELKRLAECMNDSHYRNFSKR
jgi:hypothetical protein